MKPNHDKVPVTEFTPGRSYRIAMHGDPLYTAVVTKFHGGCWATVRVEQAATDEFARVYTPGMEFDIKVANYEFEVL